MHRIVIILLLASLLWLSNKQAEAQNKDKKVRYNYLTFLPENYDSLKNQLLPVIFYLHGRSVSGTNINRIKQYGLPYFLDKGKKLDFIVVAPQCPWGKNWASENWLDTIYAEISTQYRIDSSRVYLTGMSLGGFGTWELANRYPHKFAAIAPLCGGAKDKWADNLTHLPIWVFHGANDKQVPVSRSDRMVKALEKRDAPVTYSRLAGKGHDIHRVYDDDRLYEWFSHFTLRPLNQTGNALTKIQPIQLAEQLLDEKQTDKLKLHCSFPTNNF
ncbi:carboxylesterase family protein [Sunxiuqinia sp. sy24]|uniref:carboxylesterase family protein n=1 Tax=Sunxiuqinia sp. sy24 TaxID=3461495 RepID=UPI0040461537